LAISFFNFGDIATKYRENSYYCHLMGFKESLVGKKQLQPFFERLYRISLRGMNYGLGGMVESSGEMFAINYVKQNTGYPVIFDVGANRGQYLQGLISVFGSKADIYSFEPSSSGFTELQQYKSKSVHPYQLALSDQPGELTLNFDNEGSVFASVHNQDEAVIQKSLTKHEVITATTIDDFCRENNIHTIEFLKIDVEGHELSVLKGASNLLKEGRIKYIQFEFGPSSMAARTYMRDFYKILPNYDIYRILNDGLQPMKYDVMKEIFLTSNYFAILR
jgi:FkbM family methyltransferase